MTQPTQTEMLDRYMAAQRRFRLAYDSLSIQHRIMATVVSSLRQILPSWLQVGPVAQFFGLADWYHDAYLKLGETLAWSDNVPGWHRAGAARFRVSESDPGDLDLAIDSDLVPMPPNTLAQEPEGLQGAALWVVFGVIASLAGAQIGADMLKEREQTTRKQFEFLIVQTVTNARAQGHLDQEEMLALLESLKQWEKKEQEAETSTADSISTGVKWIAGAGIVIALLNLGMNYLKWRDRTD